MRYRELLDSLGAECKDESNVDGAVQGSSRALHKRWEAWEIRRKRYPPARGVARNIP